MYLEIIEKGPDVELVIGFDVSTNNVKINVKHAPESRKTMCIRRIFENWLVL